MLCAEAGSGLILEEKSARTQGVVYGQNFSSRFSDPFWIACVLVVGLSGNAPHSGFCWKKGCTLSVTNNMQCLESGVLLLFGIV